VAERHRWLAERAARREVHPARLAESNFMSAILGLTSAKA